MDVMQRFKEMAYLPQFVGPISTLCGIWSLVFTQPITSGPEAGGFAHVFP
jgi:hypothetical protein